MRTPAVAGTRPSKRRRRLLDVTLSGAPKDDRLDALAGVQEDRASRSRVVGTPAVLSADFQTGALNVLLTMASQLSRVTSSRTVIGRLSSVSQSRVTAVAGVSSGSVSCGPLVLVPVQVG